MENCSCCGSAIDYSETLFKVDIQEWWLSRATGRKLTLCPACGTNLKLFLTPHEKENDNAM